MTPTTTADARFNKRIDIVTTIIFSVASLLTAWGGYQASQWGSIQSISLSQASTKRVQSSLAANLGSQERLLDVVTFTNWVEATGAQNQPLADFIRARFRNEFTPAFEAWVATDPIKNATAPKTPFEMPIYQPANLVKSAALEAEADALYAKGSHASDVSGLYVRATLFIAASLFFAAISKTFEERSLRLIMLGLSIALLLFGIINLIPLPVA